MTGRQHARAPERGRPARGRPWRLVAAAVLAATGVGLLEAFQLYAGLAAAGRHPSLLRAMYATIPSWYVLAALVPCVVWIARRVPVNPARWPAIAVHVVASVVFSVVSLALSSLVSDYVLPGGPELPFLQNLRRLLTIYFVLNVVFYWGIAGIYYAFDYYRRFRERERTAAQLELKASRLEAGLATANLQALRMQLNPHFLFNTLNSISVLALKGEKQKVARMLARLSELLRIALDNAAPEVPLRQELEFLERYLEIEQLRFHDRLDVALDIPEPLLDAEVPSLILQPLVENAIAHGLARTPGPGRVEVRATSDGAALRLLVRDTGPGFSTGARAEGGGIGLENTRKRLEQLYGGQQSLQTANAPEGGALVTVRIPLRLAESAHALSDATPEYVDVEDSRAHRG
ncbi:MAG TPA: histidine kinase [Longimicrobiales bacterium]|nr:histidine kinase [Longimicrobiales bacterium]